METPNLALLVLLDAKIEYTSQLIRILLPRLNEGIKSMFDTTSQLVNNEPKKILIAFQNTLSNIHKWSDETLNKEYIRILRISKCDWLDDIITAVFICNAKILSVVRTDHTQSNPIDLNVPTGKFFIHQCYIDLARELWLNPYPIYTHHLTSLEINENHRKINEMIKTSIKQTIQRLLPTKELLKQFLNKNIDELVSEAKKKIPETISSIKDDITKEITSSHITLEKLNQIPNQPTTQPIIEPSIQPTTQPIIKPSTQPTNQPTNQPTTQPTTKPIIEHSTQPTAQPTAQPTTQPIIEPSTQPTNQPLTYSTTQPSIQPTTQPIIQSNNPHTIQSLNISKSPQRPPSFLSGGSSINNIKVCEINLNDKGNSKPNSNSENVSDIITQLNNINQKRNLYFK